MQNLSSEVMKQVDAMRPHMATLSLFTVLGLIDFEHDVEDVRGKTHDGWDCLLKIRGVGEIYLGNLIHIDYMLFRIVRDKIEFHPRVIGHCRVVACVDNRDAEIFFCRWLLSKLDRSILTYDWNYGLIQMPPAPDWAGLYGYIDYENDPYDLPQVRQSPQVVTRHEALRKIAKYLQEMLLTTDLTLEEVLEVYRELSTRFVVNMPIVTDPVRLPYLED